MKNLLRQNWKAKLLSLVIALAIWFVIDRQVNQPAGGGAGGSGFIPGAFEGKLPA